MGVLEKLKRNAFELLRGQRVRQTARNFHKRIGLRSYMSQEFVLHIPTSGHITRTVGHEFHG